MPFIRPLRLACLAALAALSPRAAGAQDSLRVLRFTPAGPASLLDPVVVTFDHPVAPRLNASVDPRRVLVGGTPAGGRAFWRDPSTLVVEFDEARPPLASYTITLSPALRSEGGLPLAGRDRAPRTVALRGPRVFQTEPAGPRGLLDTIARVRLVGASHAPYDWTTIRARLVPTRRCAAAPDRRPIALRVERVRPVEPADGAMREARDADRDFRLDGLRRVVELVAEGSLPRGCEAVLEVRGPGDVVLASRSVQVRPAFAVASICETAGRCASGPLRITFTAPVAATQIREHVRLDGAAPPIGGDSASVTWRLHSSLRAGTAHTLQLSGNLRSVDGDRLGADRTEEVRIVRGPPRVTYATGSFVVPRSSPSLIRIRHANVDSVVVEVARVVDSALVTALTHSRWDGRGTWRAVAGPSILLRYATPAGDDVDGVLAVPVADLPAAWRNASPLVVRALGVERSSGTAPTRISHGTRRPNSASENIEDIDDVVQVVQDRTFATLRRSDVAIHVMDAAGEARVWVTSLRDATPLAGAAVRVIDATGRELARATADTEGAAVLRFPVPTTTGPNAGRYLVEARHGSDVNVHAVVDPYAQYRRAGVAEDDDEDSSPYRFADWKSLSRLHGAAFAERGIYRPGERVFLKGVARRFDTRVGYGTPRGDSARWLVHWVDRWPRERVWSRRGRLGEFGTVVDTFTVPRTARLGSYEATLQVARNGAWVTAATTRFAVAEYRVPEFAVRATADSAAQRFAGDTARVEIAARYLFGIPMQRASVDWWTETAELSPWEVRMPGLEGMNVGRSWWLLPDGMARATASSARGSLTTDDSGRAVVRAPVGTLSRPGRVTVHASVTDANRQTVTAGVTFPVHVADVYVGARLAQSRWVWTVGEPIAVQALVVDARGARRPGHVVEVAALRYRRESSRWQADTVWRATHTSTADTLRVTYTPDAPGQYELLFSTRDARGRRATTGVFAWVASADARDVRRGQGGLSAAVDKPRYRVGEEASVRVESDDEGPAWVTLTHEGIVWEDKVHLRRGTNVVVVPIVPLASGGAQLRVIALRPRSAADTSDVYYREAWAQVNVARDAQVLQVAITPDRARYAPRDTVRLRVAVRQPGGRGVRSELAVWAVDEGVASLTALESPDLLAALLAMQGTPYGFATTLAAMLPRIIPEWMYGSGLMLRAVGAGNGSATVVSRRIPVRMEVPAPGLQLSEVVAVAIDTVAGPTASLRQHFSTTPLYRGAVVTDAEGLARLSFELPDNLTTFRLFAVAVAEGALAGNGDTAIVSTRTLAVRPALPRVIRDGDTLLAGAVITQDRDGTAPVTLRVEASGATLSGPRVRTDSLDGRRPRELRFALQGIAADTAVLRFYGNTSRDADAAESRLAVAPAGRARAHLAMGTLEGSARLGFGFDEPLDRARSSLEVQVGSSPVPLLRRLSESLRLYPYYCTEQLSSGGRALVARIRAERMVAPDTALAARDRAQLEMGVATIVARQREDGGFGYWSAANWTSPWLTAYALEFLDGARELGVDVPAGTLARAREYLGAHGALTRLSRRGIRADAAGADTLVLPHEALAAALVLRSMRQPDTTLERRILAAVGRFDWVDRLALARLLAARGDSAGGRAIVVAAWRDTRLEGRRLVLDDSLAPRHWLFRSVTRPVVALLTTAVALTPDDARLEPLFDSMLQSGAKDRRWSWNTIDQALVADAVVAMLRRRGPRDTTTVVVTGSDAATPRATLVAGRARSDTLRTAIPAFMTPAGRDSVVVGLSASSRLPVYYAATLLEVPTSRPVRADDAGISVDRWYERYDDPRPVVEVREGELVRVRIRVTVASDGEFVVVDDALPAGLEAVDLSLRTSSALPPFEGAPRLKREQDASGPAGSRWRFGGWDGGWWTPWEHREIRDDRVVFFSRELPRGSYLISYVARATTAGSFVRPPAHAEEMYNPARHGRSDGGRFTVRPASP